MQFYFDFPFDNGDKIVINSKGSVIRILRAQLEY